MPSGEESVQLSSRRKSTGEGIKIREIWVHQNSPAIVSKSQWLIIAKARFSRLPAGQSSCHLECHQLLRWREMRPGLGPALNRSVLEVTHITSTHELLARARDSLSQPQGRQEVRSRHVPRRQRARSIWQRALMTSTEEPQKVKGSGSEAVHVGRACGEQAAGHR